MNNIRETSIAVIEKTISNAEKHINTLQELPPSDISDKLCQKAYYTFACLLTQNSNENNSVMSDISLSIRKADTDNELEQTLILSKYFDLCLTYRSVLEEYLQQNERILSQQTAPFPSKEIIKQTNIFIRNLTLLKGSYYNLQK